MEEVSEVIPRDFLSCRLCKEEFEEPKLLPCLHSFCHACLASYIRDTKDMVPVALGDQEPPGFLCPLCGTGVETRDPTELPDNVLARRLSYPSTPLPPGDAASCAQCRQKGRGEVTTSMHCVNCEESLCGACAEQHVQQEETSSHKLVSLKGGSGAAGGELAEGLLAVLSRCCALYDAYDIGATYCVDCDLALCDTCSTQHTSAQHRCAELSAVADNFVAKIQEPVQHLRRDSQTLARHLAHLDRAERHLRRAQKDVRMKIRRRTQVLCSLIGEYEGMLLQETERRHRQNLSTLQQRRIAVMQHAASITAVTELTDKLLHFGSEEEKVAMRRRVGRRVRELCEADLPSTPVEMTSLTLCEPNVTVETICNLFGELKSDLVRHGSSRQLLGTSVSLDSGHSVSESIDEEEGEGEGEGTSEWSADNKSDVDMLSNSNHSDTFLSLQQAGSEDAHLSTSGSVDPADVGNSKGSLRDSEAESAADDRDGERDVCGAAEDNANSSLQSAGSLQDNVPTQLLETPRLRMTLPDLISRDSVKGMGVNARGDVIVATKATTGSSIYLLEQHGIIRGQQAVAANWTVHSVASDGKVALIVARGDNRYKVKVMSEDGSGTVLADMHVESYGFNFATTTPSGRLLVASSRYPRSSQKGKAIRTGGNVAVYDPQGRLERRITNEDISPGDVCLMQKPHWLAADAQDNIFVADPASHCVVGITITSSLLFKLGNCDMDNEDLYQGPDSVSVDSCGHVMVMDKKEGRIDIVNYQGQLLKCLFPSETFRFVAAAPEGQLMIETTDGYVKFYNYS
ncbi:tripartite motif-containing protein 2-like isoform X3 [Pomacea canaliculata]|nr:tripartite motif-containing protein 2-like isoform X3 [Pomacea canaliculata]